MADGWKITSTVEQWETTAGGTFDEVAVTVFALVDGEEREAYTLQVFKRGMVWSIRAVRGPENTWTVTAAEARVRGEAWLEAARICDELNGVRERRVARDQIWRDDKDRMWLVMEQELGSGSRWVCRRFYGSKVKVFTAEQLLTMEQVKANGERV